MFLNIIKYKSLKKAVNKAVQTSLSQVDFGDVRTVGFVLDKKDFSSIHLLENELVKKGIKKSDIFFLIYSREKGIDTDREVFMRDGDFTTSGDLKNEKIQLFINRPFDLLINYYDVESLVLLWASSHSVAKFKVGFSSIKTHVNNFSISLTTDKFKEFIDELFRYLQLFKK